ncbi:tripartite tricarboxylate transporter TctB family protein [Ancylobacter mangrovi]|uniref:tripartite tricarboxylate transporter TctB family protein n=1 Tax=Ancylobacter mangrovi TaxID=2972472 RepID=UPI002162A529|nr:tripartite tricarboxylate transporter TctB family protein [Ancylobacter mangrovi]MCS0504302.1 tripartite tricarboxylate transporter TctB family protein [Ancylobacter mangrovi]
MENQGIVRLSRSAAELFTAVVVLAAVVALFVYSFELPPSPMRGYPGAGFMPRLVLIYTAVFTVIWLGRLVLARARSARETRALAPAAGDDSIEFEYRGYLVTIATVLAFVVGLQYLGFEITCFGILSLLLAVRLSSVALAVAVAALTTLILYAVFVLLLNVSVPLAILPDFITF